MVTNVDQSFLRCRILSKDRMKVYVEKAVWVAEDFLVAIPHVATRINCTVLLIKPLKTDAKMVLIWFYIGVQPNYVVKQQQIVLLRLCLMFKISKIPL